MECPKLCQQCLAREAQISEVVSPFHAFCDRRCQARFHGLATADAFMGAHDDGAGGGGGGGGGDSSAAAQKRPLASLVLGKSSSSGFALDVEGETRANTAFRRVVAEAGNALQLVLMSITPGDKEIGVERHQETQFFRVEAGRGRATVGDLTIELYPGAAFVVLGGIAHNVINLDDTEPLKLYSLYVPPHHPHGTVHARRPRREPETLPPAATSPKNKAKIAPSSPGEEDVVLKKALL